MRRFIFIESKIFKKIKVLIKNTFFIMKMLIYAKNSKFKKKNYINNKSKIIHYAQRKVKKF